MIRSKQYSKMIHFAAENIDTHSPLAWPLAFNWKDRLKSPFEIEMLKYNFHKPFRSSFWLKIIGVQLGILFCYSTELRRKYLQEIADPGREIIYNRFIYHYYQHLRFSLTRFYETWFNLDLFAEHPKEKNKELNYEQWKVNYI